MMRAQSSPFGLPVPRFFLALLFLICGIGFAYAKPLLNPMFTDHAVLQRDAMVPIWGWTSPGAPVTVTLNSQSYGQTVGGVADLDGRWQVSAGPFPAGGPYTMTVTGPQTQVLTDILMGDVYVCSGQSNMALMVSATLNATAEIADSANYPNVRHLLVQTTQAATPQDLLPSGSTAWQLPGTLTTGNFTAVGYFMGRELNKRLQVPIGIICNPFGGTIIQQWLDATAAGQTADFYQNLYDLPGAPMAVAAGTAIPTSNVTTLFNAMVAPVIPYRIKAVAWYQGESNYTASEQYSRLLPLLMTQWRSHFGQPNLPFLIVQLANYQSTQTAPVENGSYAELREAQQKTVCNDANSRLVSTIDLGGPSPVDLHQKNKQDIGLRACWSVLDLVFGQDVVASGPVFTGATVTGGTMRCSFNNVGKGLMIGSKTQLQPTQQLVSGTLTGFALAGSDKKYYIATAVIDPSNNTVLLSSTSVPSPVTVRYAWGWNPIGNLYNKITDNNGVVMDGLPATPFRSDPTAAFSVNSGSPSKTTLLNTAYSITANADPVGEVFDHWSGDTGMLSSATARSPTVTMSQKYGSVLANYRITASPSNISGLAENSRVTLQWSPLTAAHYNLKRGTASGGPYVTIARNLMGPTTYVDLSPTNGTTYYYVVSASNLTGEGPDSGPIPATPIPVVNDLKAVGVGSQNVLTWSAFNGVFNSYTVKRGTSSGGPYATIASGLSTLIYTDQDVAGGNNYFYVVCVATSQGESSNSQEATATPSFIPAPMMEVDVGAVGYPGYSACANGTWTVAGSGRDIFGTADSYHAVYTSLAASGTITARVVSQQNTNASAKAGLMMRGSFDPAYPNVCMEVGPGGKSTFQYRTAWGQSTTQTMVTGSNQWIRLVRAGTTFTGYTSADGLSWVQVGSPQTISSMSSSLYVQLAVSSADNTKLGVASFDHVSGFGTFQTSPVPTGLGAMAGNAQVTLRWNASSGAAGYNVKRAASTNGTYSTIASALNATSFVDDGLSNGTTWFYAVSAVNEAGESANSLQVYATPGSGSTPLNAPGGFTGAAGNGQAILSWTAVSGATSYSLKRSTTNGSNFQNVTSNITSTSCTNSSLSNGTPYYYAVTALNQNGESAFSNQVAVTPVSPAPTGLTAQSSGNGGVALNWTAVTGATQRYNIKRSTVSGGPYTTVATGVKTNSFADSILTNGTPYYYVVSWGNNQSEGANSSQVSVMPVSPVPSAPTGLAGQAGNGQAVLTWSPVATTSYNIKWSTASGGPYAIGATGIYAPIFTGTGLTNQTTYYYVVAGVNANGEGANSAETSVTPGLPPIGPGELVGPGIAVSNGSVNLAIRSSVPGRSYQLQWSGDLKAGSWQNVGSVQIGTGFDLTFTDFYNAPVKKRFYRVLIGS